MCMLCVEFQKQKMTIPEAWRAFGEMKSVIEESHVEEVLDMLREAEELEKLKKKLEEEGSTIEPYATR